jgi:hypothetical protein
MLGNKMAPRTRAKVDQFHPDGPAGARFESAKARRALPRRSTWVLTGDSNVWCNHIDTEQATHVCGLSDRPALSSSSQLQGVRRKAVIQVSPPREACHSSTHYFECGKSKFERTHAAHGPNTRPKTLTLTIIVRGESIY